MVTGIVQRGNVIAERLPAAVDGDVDGHFLLRIGHIGTGTDEVIVGDVERNAVVNGTPQERFGLRVGLNGLEGLRVDHHDTSGHGFENRAEVFPFLFGGLIEATVFDGDGNLRDQSANKLFIALIQIGLIQTTPDQQGTDDFQTIIDGGDDVLTDGSQLANLHALIGGIAEGVVDDEHTVQADGIDQSVIAGTEIKIDIGIDGVIFGIFPRDFIQAVRIIFVDEGEQPAVIAGWLGDTREDLTNVLLELGTDLTGELTDFGESERTLGFGTRFFEQEPVFDGNGDLVDDGLCIADVLFVEGIRLIRFGDEDAEPVALGAEGDYDGTL